MSVTDDGAVMLASDSASVLAAATPTLTTIDNVAFASVILADPDSMLAPGMVGCRVK